MTYSFLIISSLWMNITEYKNESINIVIHSCSSWSNVATLSCPRTSFSRSLFSPRSIQPLFGYSLISFFAL